MNSFSRNLITIGLSSVSSLILSLLLNAFSPLKSQHWYFEITGLLIFFFSFNLIYAKQVGTENFTQLLMAAIVIKLLLTLSTIFIYSVLNKPGFFGFSIHFILHYILFTIFEIRYLLHIIKTHSLKQH